MTPDQATPEEIVTAFIEAVVAGDLDAAAALCADDIEYDNVPMGPVTGHDAMKGVLSMIEESEWTVHRQVAAGSTVMNERTDRLKVNGTWVDLPVAGVFEIINGRIALWRDYFDLRTLESVLAPPE